MAVLPVPQLRPLPVGGGLRSIGQAAQGAISGAATGYRQGQQIRSSALDIANKEAEAEEFKRKIEEAAKTKEGRQTMKAQTIERIISLIPEDEKIEYKNNFENFLSNIDVNTKEGYDDFMMVTANVAGHIPIRADYKDKGLQTFNYSPDAYRSAKFLEMAKSGYENAYKAKVEGIASEALNKKGPKTYEEAVGTLMGVKEVIPYMESENIQVMLSGYKDPGQRAALANASAAKTRANRPPSGMTPDPNDSNKAYMNFTKKAEKAGDVIHILKGNVYEENTDRKKVFFFQDALENRKKELNTEMENKIKKQRDYISMAMMAATAATNPELFGGRGFNDAQIEIIYDDLRDKKPSNEYAKTFLETLRLPQWEVKPEGSLIGSPILDKQTNTQPMIGPSPKPTQSPAQTQPVTRIGNLGQFKTPAKIGSGL